MICSSDLPTTSPTRSLFLVLLLPSLLAPLLLLSFSANAQDPNDSMLCFASSSTANSSYACLYLPGDYPYPGSVSSSLKTVLTPSDNVSIAFSEDFYLFCMRFIGSSSSFFRCMNTTSEVDFTLSFAFPLAVAESKISIIPLPPSQGVYGISEALRQHPTPSTVLYHLQVQNLIDNTQDAYNSPSSFSWAFPYSAPPPFNPLSVSTLPVRNGSRTDIYAVATGGHAAGIIGMSIPQPNPGLVPFPVTGSPLVVSASLAESVLTCAHAPGSGFAFAMRHSVPGNTSGGTIVTRTTMTTALLSIEIFNTSKSFATVVVSTASIDYEYTFDVARSLMSTNVKEYVDNTPAPFFYSARSPNGDYFVTARCSNSTSSCSLSPYLVLANGLFPLNKTVVSLLPGRDASQAKFAINNQGRLRMAYIVKRTSPPPDLYYLEFVAFEAAYKQTLFSERFIGGSGPYSFLDFQVGPGPDPLSCAAISPSNLLVCAKTNLPTSLSNPLFSHTFPPELTDVKFRMGIPSLSTAPTAPTTLCPPAQQVSCTLAGNVNVTSGETVINLPSMIGGSLFISSTLTVSNSLSVGANLSLASTSLLVITPQASSSPITVSGCANLAGQLVVEVPPTATVGDNSLTILNASCITGTLVSVQVKASGCQQASNARPVYSRNQLSVAFSLSSTCPTDGQETDGFIPGLSMTASLAVAIAVPLVLILIVVAAVLLINPTTRKKLFPFRDREHYTMQTRPSTARSRLERV